MGLNPTLTAVDYDPHDSADDVPTMANRFSGIVERHGLIPEKAQRSNLSDSQYLSYSHPNSDVTARIRVSNHVAKPTYERLNGVPDVEIGAHDMGGSVVSGAANTLGMFGIKPDKRLSEAIDFESKQRQAFYDRWKAGPSKEVQEFEAKQKAVEAWAGERWPGYDAKNKKKRQALRREYDLQSQATGNSQANGDSQ